LKRKRNKAPTAAKGREEAGFQLVSISAETLRSLRRIFHVLPEASPFYGKFCGIE
jgi:hypothetical protein